MTVPVPDYERLPCLVSGAEPPGRSVDGRWIGPLKRRTHHGPAVVEWRWGRPETVWNALLPDGSRSFADRALDHGWRRPSIGPRRWVQGNVDVDPDDVAFTDRKHVSLPLPALPQPGAEPDLEAELSHDAAFVADLRDFSFLQVAKAALTGEFVKAGRSGWQVIGDKYAALLVAAAADMGELYGLPVRTHHARPHASSKGTARG